MSALLPVAN